MAADVLRPPRSPIFSPPQAIACCARRPHSPSPGIPGDASGIGGCPRAASGISGCPRAGGGESDFDHQVLGTRDSGHLVLPITLTLPSPRVPGEGSCRARAIASTYLRVAPGASTYVISLPPTASAAASPKP